MNLAFLNGALVVAAIAALTFQSWLVFWIVAAMLIGVLDFVLKIYFPKGGTMFIYALTLILLLWRPQGLFGKRA